ncbi:rhodanese-like domain-containing protein [Desulfovibrio litoralis]|uniref:rhodanese-like domain-containing protein n=1 Tax=Desulfovibrio litoralis TaxID=466107 RepID=UPI0015B99E7C|nr:rhodanese-like domain-containing protein [Desulfovibrio litoralis]
MQCSFFSVTTLAGTLDQRVFHLNERATVELLEKNIDLVIIDLRTPREFEESHIKDAININAFSKNFEEEILALVKEFGTSKPWLVYCRTGNRSLKALPDIIRLFPGTIYHIKDGIAYSSIPLESDNK